MLEKIKIFFWELDSELYFWQQIHKLEKVIRKEQKTKCKK